MNPKVLQKAVRLSTQVVKRNDGSYAVPGDTGTYTVSFSKPGAFGFEGSDIASCTCPALRNCSHIQAVQFALHPPQERSSHP